LRLFSFGGYGLALAELALVVFGAYDSYPTGTITKNKTCTSTAKIDTDILCTSKVEIKSSFAFKSTETLFLDVCVGNTIAITWPSVRSYGHT